ncbi:hypothetical protein [Rhizobium sp. TRM95796]|uniref:hypothetical protein n=1 Tax=Rhizobium sp. TRM95796 TaxID=2979862 RepID=UPI0021E88742|nr:hypothetical protein [Rhizobium sp. TRM95796]MCV3766641.1 hypothetical protein [Rhizobium sp. TRM95796]
MAHDEVSPAMAGRLVGKAAAPFGSVEQAGLSPMRVNVHLGVHKTATTFIQAQLHDHGSLLAEGSIRYAGISAVRQNFTKLFDALAWTDAISGAMARPLLARRLEALIRSHGRGDTFILSDENLLGLISANYWTGRLYPAAHRRIRMLDSLLKGREAHYFLSIRRYPDYLTSSWLQLASRGKAPAFDRYLAKFKPDCRGWAEVVADMAAACGADKLTVWTYDWLSANPARVFGLLAPSVAFVVPDEELRRDVLPSLTLKGLKVLNELKPHLSANELKNVARMMRGFPFDEPNPRLEITDPGLVAAYEDKYQSDLARIRASGVELYD